MPLPVVREKLLINAGPSERGWSSVESFARCERLYYLSRVLPRRRAAVLAAKVASGELVEAAAHVAPELSEPLVRGAIGHVGLAHEYTRRWAARHGQDPDAYYDRNEAMRLVSLTFGDTGAAMLEVVTPVIDGYFLHYDALGEQLDVLAVEAPVSAILGDGEQITQRLDLVVRDKHGKVWVVDHKIVAKPAQVDRYTLSGQFLLMHHFGRSFYGEDFAGTLINLLGTTPDDHGKYEYVRRAPEPAPAALAAFPSFIVELRRRIKEKEGQPGSAYLPAFNEQTCYSSYGRCSMFSTCQWEYGLGR